MTNKRKTVWQTARQLFLILKITHSKSVFNFFFTVINSTSFQELFKQQRIN